MTVSYPKKLQKTYVSDIGELIKSTTATSKTKSEARQMEVSKYRRIHFLRDQVDTSGDKNLIWEDF